MDALLYFAVFGWVMFGASLALAWWKMKQASDAYTDLFDNSRYALKEAEKHARGLINEIDNLTKTIEINKLADEAVKEIHNE